MDNDHDLLVKIATRQQTVLQQMQDTDKRLGKLESRINWLFGALAVIVVLANLAIQVRLI